MRYDDKGLSLVVCSQKDLYVIGVVCMRSEFSKEDRDAHSRISPTFYVEQG